MHCHNTRHLIYCAEHCPSDDESDLRWSGPPSPAPLFDEEWKWRFHVEIYAHLKARDVVMQKLSEMRHDHQVTEGARNMMKLSECAPQMVYP